MAKIPNFVDTSDHAYRARLTDVLIRNYFTDTPAGYFETPLGRDALADHISRRYHMAMDHVVPWLATMFDLSTMTMIEIGSGTGSSTLAFGQVAQCVDCYELSSLSTAVARERLNFWGISNVTLQATAFDADCSFVQSGRQVNAIILYATLEHMTHAEALQTLALAWKVLRPGGILVVAETPNRFSLVDEHTSWLPLFSQLPKSIQVRYAEKSPREDFRRAIADARAISEEVALATMTRWGSGISFHEFELAIGESVHEWIVLDGYEPHITDLFPVSTNDQALQALFEQFQVKAHRAFTRRTFFFVVQKPDFIP